MRKPYLSSFTKATSPWLLALPIFAISATLSAQTVSDESAFTAENATAMDRMMAGMDVKPTGDVDRDFVAMMIPHHQGAIDMAQAELRYGKNEQLRRIAQEIIVDQQQEIDAMHIALGQAPTPSAPVPTQVTKPSTGMPADMPMDMPASSMHHDHAAH